MSNLEVRLTMITLRPVDPDRDFPGIVQVVNAIDPEPITAEEYAAMYQSAATWTAYRVVALDPQQQVHGYATATRSPAAPQGQFNVWVAVDPAYTRRGIGSSLYSELWSFLTTQQVTVLLSDVSDACPACLAFAQQRGFRVERHLFESTLELAHFNMSAYDGVLDAVAAQGIRFQTFAELSPSAENQHKLYELDRRIEQDIPGMDWFPETFETFRQRFFDDPCCEPQGKIVALDGEQWVGLAIVRLIPASNAAYNLMTGIERGYRGRKIALALKLLAIQYAQRRAVAYIRTNNDSENTPILALNRKLGYRPRPGKYLLRKDIG